MWRNTTAGSDSDFDMRIYFSGWGGEHRGAGMKERPSFMLTFWDLRKKSKKQTTILKAYLKRKHHENKQRRVSK